MVVCISIVIFHGIYSPLLTKYFFCRGLNFFLCLVGSWGWEYFKILGDLLYWEVLISFFGEENVRNVLNGRLPFWEDSSRPPVSHWSIPFWDDPGLLVRYLWIFQIYHTFYKLDVKILAAINEFKNVRSTWSLSSPWAVDPCQQRTCLLAQSKRHPENLV